MCYADILLLKIMVVLTVVWLLDYVGPILSFRAITVLLEDIYRMWSYTVN